MMKDGKILMNIIIVIMDYIIIITKENVWERYGVFPSLFPFIVLQCQVVSFIGIVTIHTFSM